VVRGAWCVVRVRVRVRCLASAAAERTVQLSVEAGGSVASPMQLALQVTNMPGLQRGLAAALGLAEAGLAYELYDEDFEEWASPNALVDVGDGVLRARVTSGTPLQPLRPPPVGAPLAGAQLGGPPLGVGSMPTSPRRRSASVAVGSFGAPTIGRQEKAESMHGALPPVAGGERDASHPEGLDGPATWGGRGLGAGAAMPSLREEVEELRESFGRGDNSGSQLVRQSRPPPSAHACTSCFCRCVSCARACGGCRGARRAGSSCVGTLNGSSWVPWRGAGIGWWGAGSSRGRPR
jgi:hypothetical protein